MFNDDDEAPASVMVSTPSGGSFDINNISGARKRKLIQEGKVSMDKFVTPDNMSGKKLAQLRANHAKNQGVITKTNVSVGDLVEFKKKVSQVVEVNPKKGVKISKGKGEVSKWIPFNRVKPVTPEEEED